MPHLLRLASAYFAVQAVSVLTWWTLLLLRPEVRFYFQFGDSDVSLLAFWLPDLLVLAAGSALVAFFCFHARPLLTPALWLVAGGIIYGTLYCLASSLATGTGWLGFLLMAPAALVTTAFAVALLPNVQSLLLQARPASWRFNLLKTSMQIVAFWGILLFVIPALLLRLPPAVSLPMFDVPGQSTGGVLLFLLFSCLGLWSGYSLVIFGEGTPLPIDSTRRLVVAGPYAWVRNPMAISGFGQGLAVALFTGSALVTCYVLLGGLIWQYIVRPVEEQQLVERFGAEYEAYREEVRCWLPRSVPYTRMRTA